MKHLTIGVRKTYHIEKDTIELQEFDVSCRVVEYNKDILIRDLSF